MLREGDTVEYEKIFDERRGKVNAANVTGGCDEGDEPPTSTSQGGSGGGGGSSDGVRHKGTAQRWNERGFGFIKPDDDSEVCVCFRALVAWARVPLTPAGHGVGKTNGRLLFLEPCIFVGKVCVQTLRAHDVCVVAAVRACARAFPMVV